MATYYCRINSGTASMTDPSHWSSTGSDVSYGDALTEINWADGDFCYLYASSDLTLKFNGVNKIVGFHGTLDSKKTITLVPDSSTKFGTLDTDLIISPQTAIPLYFYRDVRPAKYTINNATSINLVGNSNQQILSINTISGYGIDPDVPIIIDKELGSVNIIQYSSSANKAHDALLVSGSCPTIMINDLASANTALGESYTAASYGPIKLNGDLTCDSLLMANGVSSTYPTLVQIPSGKTLQSSATTWGTNSIIDGDGSTYGTYCTACTGGVQNATGTANVASGINATCLVTVTPLESLALSTDSPSVGTAISATLSPSDATATYQWSRCTTSDGTFDDISGATNANYTPVAGDAGYYIRCTATGTGGSTGTASATTTAACVMPQLSTPVLALESYGQKSVILTGLVAETGETVASWSLRYATTEAGLSSATASTVTPTDGIYTLAGLTPGATYYVQIQAVGNGTPWGSSAWSNAVSATLDAAGSLIVQNANNTGNGSLRQCLADAVSGDTITFDASLSGATITLTRPLIAYYEWTVDGSTLKDPLTISGGNTWTNGVSNNDGCQIISHSSYINGRFKNLIFTCGNIQPISVGIFYNCLFIRNVGLYGVLRWVTLYNCTVTNNNGTTQGAVYPNANSYTRIYNSIIVENTPCDISYHNDDRFTGYNNISSFTDWKHGSGNIAYDSAKPLFVDAANGDYHLAAGSQACGIGANEYVTDGDTDLDGNTRISGANVDAGCYEYQPVQLAAPTLAVEVSGRTATIEVTWATGATGATLQYASDSAFASPAEMTITSQTEFTVPNLGGTVYFRSKALGDTGNESYTDSSWGETTSEYFDNEAPVIVGVNPTEPLTITRGASADVTAGVTVTDNVDSDLIPYYEIYDAESNVVSESGGNYINIDTANLAAGTYLILYYAIDAAGNESSDVTRTLIVESGGTVTIDAFRGMEDVFGEWTRVGAYALGVPAAIEDIEPKA